MQAGKGHAQQTQPPVPDEQPRALGSPTRDNTEQPAVSWLSNTQPTVPDEPSGDSSGPASESDAGIFQDVFVEGYRKEEVSKATVYVEIQSKLRKALGDDWARLDAMSGSFIATIESHDAEVGATARKGRVFDPTQCSSNPPVLDSDGQQSDDKPITKKFKVNESAHAWVKSRRDKHTILRDTLSKTLKLIKTNTIDPEAIKQYLVNKPDCPEFPNSE